MQAQVVGLDQSVSFEDGSITNFLLLRLGTGHVIRAVITEESAQFLVDSFAGVPPQSAVRPLTAPPTERQELQTSMDEMAPSHVFGGDLPNVASAEAQTPWLPKPAPTAVVINETTTSRPTHQSVEAQTRAFKEAQKKQNDRMKHGPTIGRSVPKDEFGYPKVRGEGVDPNDIVSQNGRSPSADEDGIGSI